MPPSQRLSRTTSSLSKGDTVVCCLWPQRPTTALTTNDAQEQLTEENTILPALFRSPCSRRGQRNNKMETSPKRKQGRGGKQSRRKGVCKNVATCALIASYVDWGQLSPAGGNRNNRYQKLTIAAYPPAQSVDRTCAGGNNALSRGSIPKQST